MTVGELKKQLENVDDNIEVTMDSPANDVLAIRVLEANVNFKRSTKLVLYSDLDYL